MRDLRHWQSCYGHVTVLNRFDFETSPSGALVKNAENGFHREDERWILVYAAQSSNLTMLAKRTIVLGNKSAIGLERLDDLLWSPLRRRLKISKRARCWFHGFVVHGICIIAGVSEKPVNYLKLKAKP
jgi:hypothetical protein